VSYLQFASFNKMLYKILILGLSALSIVGVSSTTIACLGGDDSYSAVQAGSVVPTLKTPGLYQISQPAPGGPYSAKYVQTFGDGAPLYVLPLSGHEQYVPMVSLLPLHGRAAEYSNSRSACAVVGSGGWRGSVPLGALRFTGDACCLEWIGFRHRVRGPGAVLDVVNRKCRQRPLGCTY
jgi:hypothetical protein